MAVITEYGSPMRERARHISDADKHAHARLRALWDAKAKGLKLTQEAAAKQYGGTQALISAYLTGRAALGRVATMKFARLLKVDPSDIRNDFEFTRQLSDEVPDDVIELAWKMASLPERVRKDLARTVDLLLQASNYEAFLENAEKAKSL